MALLIRAPGTNECVHTQLRCKWLAWPHLEGYVFFRNFSLLTVHSNIASKS